MKHYVAAIALILASFTARAADPDVLWKFVHDKCVPGQMQAQDPKPCVEVSLADGVAVLKDINGIAQHLLIPTAKNTGMDDPAVLAPATPNYFAAAWKARHFMDGKLDKTLPRDAISLAINSVSGRTQNQLHIHIDCVRPDVRAVLHGQSADHWASVKMPGGNSYKVRQIAGSDLEAVNPFLLLAREQPDSVADYAHHTLVAVGAVLPDGREGFYLLDDHADLATLDRASGEELQDHGCEVAK